MLTSFSSQSLIGNVISTDYVLKNSKRKITFQYINILKK